MSAEGAEAAVPMDAVTSYRHGVDEVSEIVHSVIPTTTQLCPAGTDVTEKVTPALGWSCQETVTAAMPGFTFTSVGMAGVADPDEGEAAAASGSAEAPEVAASTTKHAIPPSRHTP